MSDAAEVIRVMKKLRSCATGLAFSVADGKILVGGKKTAGLPPMEMKMFTIPASYFMSLNAIPP